MHTNFVVCYTRMPTGSLPCVKNSLEFAIARIFMKISQTGSLKIITVYKRHFTFPPVTKLLTIRTAKFVRCFYGI